MQIQMELEEFPARLVWDRPLSDEEFERICQANSVMQLERTKRGELIVNPPTGGFTSDGNREIIYQLSAWWKQHKQGRAFDSSAGFFLPDGSMLSPDAAYVRSGQLKGLTREAGNHLLHICPDFIIELLSSSDRLPAAKAKMQNWIANGTVLGWLVDPYQRKVYVYEPAKPMRTETGSHVAGSGAVEGFVLDLKEVWSCYEPEDPGGITAL